MIKKTLFEKKNVRMQYKTRVRRYVLFTEPVIILLETLQLNIY